MSMRTTPIRTRIRAAVLTFLVFGQFFALACFESRFSRVSNGDSEREVRHRLGAPSRVLRHHELASATFDGCDKPRIRSVLAYRHKKHEYYVALDSSNHVVCTTKVFFLSSAAR